LKKTFLGKEHRDKTIFDDIVTGHTHVKKIYEDEGTLAFYDVSI